ncbi:NAD(P)/FAD-dependent oxidoreductase [Glycomyces terrestris]|uniref:NAD(P)/FAD-dependent oxidoreductase n=1 Tax=Glycomyces terrestris TaxID=2493553 RepID=A0A426V3N6_9ACTN|nr:FAD-dependent oxidoreductase [Glycomyces terrestris]RRS01440.1 NAD(P)/FAD-dependent oxidoreductase [Glycomyces terrestris]
MDTTPRVLVVGGGLAGMETLFALRQRLGDRVDLTLVTDRDDFEFRPSTVYVPFGGAEDDLRIPVAVPAERQGITVRRGEVAWVETEPKRLALTDGCTLDYDYLVLATGAAMRPERVPGLAEHAHLVGSLEQMRELGRTLRRVRDAAVDGSPQHVLFLVPPGNAWPGPVYELAFMLETWLRRSRVRDLVCLTFATFEDRYLEALGTGLHPVIGEEFADRGIISRARAVVTGVEPNLVRFADGTAHTFDVLVSSAPHTAAVDYEGLPKDLNGFLLTEPQTRRVRCTDVVYAPGDAGDFPVKLGYLSLLQADAVADDITARIDPAAVGEPRRFDPVGMFVLEMLDEAVYARTPLALTGEPDRARDGRRVGVSPIWHLGKKTLGVYLPQQFRAGRPVHGGLHQQAVALGLQGLSTTWSDRVTE